MQPYRTEKKNTMYVQTILKRQLVTTLLEIAASAGNDDKNEEDIEDETEPAASETLNENQLIAMTKTVGKWPPFAPFTMWLSVSCRSSMCLASERI